MSFGRYALGVGALLCVFGSLGAGAVALRAALVPGWRGAPARLAEAVLGLGLLEVTIELLGTVGLFRLGPVVLAALAVGGGVWVKLSPRVRAMPAAPWRGWTWSTRVAAGASVVVAGVVLAEWAGPTLQSWGRGILGADSVAYHMPWAASFAQTGQITSIRYTDIEWLTGFYPATYELFHGLGIVLMGTDVLSPGVNFLWTALVLLAAWCVGSPFGRGPQSLVGGAVVVAAPMMFFSSAGTADNDPAGVFFVLAAVALWLNARDAARARALLPAAVAAGLALSIKLNLVAPVAALTVAAIWATPPGVRRSAAKHWFAGAFVTGAFWYLRNLFAVGNPLPYFSFLGVLPTPSPGPTQEHNNYAITNYLHYPHIWTTWFKGALAGGLGPWWVVILVLGFVGPALCVTFGPTRVVRLAGGVALAGLIAYLFTPGSASGPFGHPRGFSLNLRYVAPPLAVALTVAPLARPLSGRWARWLVLGGGLAIFLAGIAQKRLWGPGYSRSGEIVAAALVLLIGVVAVGWPWAVPRLHSPTLRRVALTTGLLTLALASVAAGYSGDKHYLRGRYVQQPGLRYITQLWRWARGVHHRRIALAGTLGWYFGYPLYGMDNSNHVDYLGHHGEHGSFRQISSCRAWRQAVDAGHYSYVVAAASRVMWSGQIKSSPEGGWTATDPHARLLFPSGSRPWLRVYSLSGPLDPAGCG